MELFRSPQVRLSLLAGVLMLTAWALPGLDLDSPITDSFTTMAVADVLLRLTMMSIVLSVLVLLFRHPIERTSGKQRDPGSVVVRGAASLLPRAARCRWAEEWTGELYDLRAEGARWHRRVGYVFTVLCWTVPVLAVQLRLRPQQVVD